MRSIFGKCIAIAMMAAIALVFHSPPVQADHEDNRDDAREAASDAESAAGAAEAHATDTKDASDAAEAAAEAAREAADDAETAAQAVKDAADSTTDQQDEASDAMREADDAANAAELAAGNTADPVLAATILIGAIATNDNAASLSALADALAGEDDDDSATAAGGLDVNSPTDPTTTAWALANYAKDQADAASDVAVAADNAANLTAAENAADDAAARRDAAEIASKAASPHEIEARRQYAEALDQVRLAVAIAQDATEEAAAEAEKKAVEEPSAVNTFEAEQAREAANDAAAAAEKYAKAADGDDDDDDDSTSMGDAAVTANGVGNMLQFGYWTTMGKDTLVAVTNLGDAQEMVTVAIMDDMRMAAGTITVCLAAGDTWTSAIISSGESTSSVMGGDHGECSGAIPDTDLNATSGFIEVSTMDGEGSLMGLATLVNAADGYASTYNATSLDVAAEGDVAGALAMEGGIQKDMLLGRWGANASIGGMTQIMLTFPVAGTAPMGQVAIEVTDEMGTSMVVASMMLDRAVNMCTFATDAMDATMTMLSCNGGQGFPVTPAEGWFKITAPDDMGFSVIGMVSQSFDGTNGMFDQSYPVQWMEMPDMDMME